MEVEEIKAKIIELMELLPLNESGDFNVLLLAYDIRNEMRESFQKEMDDKALYSFEKKTQALEQLIEVNNIIKRTWTGLTAPEREEFIAGGLGIKKIIQHRKNATIQGSNNNRLHSGTNPDVQPGEPD